MDHLPGTLSIHLNDALSRQFGEQIDNGDSNIDDEEDENDDLYLYDEPPPYDISAKLLEINAELANIQLPRESEDGRPRKVTFLENLVHSEIPPTPTDSTDEDDGYGDSTEASDDADGFCAHNPLGVAPLANSDEDHHDLIQQENLRAKHAPATVVGLDWTVADYSSIHDNLRLNPTRKSTNVSLEDDVSQLLMFAKTRQNANVENNINAGCQTNSLADELNQFLKSFTEMAIKNGAEAARDDVTESTAVCTSPSDEAKVRRNTSEESDDIAVDGNCSEPDDSTTIEDNAARRVKKCYEINKIQDQTVASSERCTNQLSYSDDISSNHYNIEADKIKCNPVNGDVTSIKNILDRSVSPVPTNNTEKQPINYFDGQRLTLTNSAPRTSKMERNPISNFLKWKRAFRLIHRTKSVSNQWSTTIDKMSALNSRSPSGPMTVNQSDNEIPDTVSLQNVLTSQRINTTSNSNSQIHESSITSSTNNSLVTTLETNLSKTENLLQQCPNKLPTILPLPAIGERSQPKPNHQPEPETMIMTSLDGQFCMMTTEDFQSLNGESTSSTKSGNHATLEISRDVTTIAQLTTERRSQNISTSKKGSSVTVPRPLKFNRVSPGVVSKSSQPLLRKSNSTLSSVAGCGKSSAGKPYSRGTFPAKAIPGMRAQSASATAGRHSNRGPDSGFKLNNLLPPDGTKNIFPPHGYGLSDEQKIEREKKLKKIELERQMKKQRELEETQKRKLEGEEAFQAWLRQKRRGSHPYPNKSDPNQSNSTSHQGKESGLAFQEWLKRKKAQQQEERRVEEFKEMVEEQMHYIRTREQNEKAFKKWLRRKRKRSGLLIGQI